MFLAGLHRLYFELSLFLNNSSNTLQHFGGKAKELEQLMGLCTLKFIHYL